MIEKIIKKLVSPILQNVKFQTSKSVRKLDFFEAVKHVVDIESMFVLASCEVACNASFLNWTRFDLKLISEVLLIGNIHLKKISK